MAPGQCCQAWGAGWGLPGRFGKIRRPLSFPFWVVSHHLLAATSWGCCQHWAGCGERGAWEGVRGVLCITLYGVVFASAAGGSQPLPLWQVITCGKDGDGAARGGKRGEDVSGLSGRFNILRPFPCGLCHPMSMCAVATLDGVRSLGQRAGGVGGQGGVQGCSWQACGALLPWFSNALQPCEWRVVEWRVERRVFTTNARV